MKRSLRLCRVLILVVSAGLLSVVVGAAIAQPPPRDAGPAQPRQLTPEDQARRAKVIAKVNDITITVGEVEDSINQQSPFLRARYRDPQVLREFVQNMIRFELMAREAERKGYGRDEAVVRSQKQNAVQQLIRREFDERITVETVPMDDVRAYYEAHPEEFSRPEMVRASHILLASEEEARQVLEKARGADARAFRSLAREHSIDTETKLRGGDLRYFTREGRALNTTDEPVDPALVAAAFELREVNDVSRAPVRVGEHWSIVMLTGRRPAENRPLDDAAQGIRLRLWRERRQQAIEDFVAGLRRRHPPEVHEDRMSAIHLDPAPEGGGHEGFPEGGKAGPTKATKGKRPARNEDEAEDRH